MRGVVNYSRMLWMIDTNLGIYIRTGAGCGLGKSSVCLGAMTTFKFSRGTVLRELN